MIRRHPKSTRTDTPFPYTTHFRSRLHDPPCACRAVAAHAGEHHRHRTRAKGFGHGREHRIDRRKACKRLPPVVKHDACPAPRTPPACQVRLAGRDINMIGRSEEHTSELQSLMRISYAVFCLTKKK